MVHVLIFCLTNTGISGSWMGSGEGLGVRGVLRRVDMVENIPWLPRISEETVAFSIGRVTPICMSSSTKQNTIELLSATMDLEWVTSHSSSQSYLADFLRLRLGGVVGVRNYAKSSFSLRELSISGTWSRTWPFDIESSALPAELSYYPIIWCFTHWAIPQSHSALTTELPHYPIVLYPQSYPLSYSALATELPAIP